MSSGWEHSEDFGQKVDLTVRIREILRNYPEGLSILKELLQNADDAGARTIKFCTAEPRPIQSNVQSTDNLSNIMKGPSLFAFNSAKFTETDFKSIQRIGDSLKKDKSGTKTGRFGVGVNSCYHLTDVPMFASGSKIVMFDPMANHVPNINPANPGKMIDCANQQGRSLVQSLPHVFDPMKIFGCDLSGKDFNGTLFRFALRTEEQAQVSRLSRQAHPLNETRDLLQQMGSAAPKMLLFLKNVECIEIYDWKANDSSPTMISRTAVGNASDKLRLRRSYVLNAPSRVPTQPQAVDYLLDIETTSIDKSISDGTQIDVDGWNGAMSTAGKKTERWIVCNQLGGGNASKMANDPALSHMKLVPWAGVAARLSPACKVDQGNAYCFLPLPVHTKLPVHVNGYFELSSNRRDVWWGDDMAGDGRARAEWNKSIVQDIAAPCYIRLLTTAIRANQVTKDTYESLFPQKDLVGPWRILGEQFMRGIVDAPVLYSDCVDGSNWIEPKRSLLMHDDNNKKLYQMLAMDKLPLVLLASEDLKKMLLRLQICRNTTSPSILRRYFSNRKELQTGCLEVETRIQNAEYLLDICKSDLSINDYSALSGCQFIPLASGDLGRFTILPDFDSGGFQQLQSMGFSKLLSAHALRLCKNDADAAMEWLLTNRYNDEAVSVTHGIDPFLVCGEDTASILRKSAPESFVDLDLIDDPNLKKFLSANAVSRLLNLLPVQNDMLADIVSRAVPCDWRGKESSPWSPDREYPDVQWFISLWRYICSSTDVKSSLTSIAEHFCIVPTNEGVVCSLSPGNSIITTNGLNEKILQSLVRVGVRTLYNNVFPTDLVIPSEIYSYIFDSTRDGVIRAIDAASRRKFSGWDNVPTPQDEMKDCIFHFFVSKDHCPISTPCKVMLRNFPIFRRFLNEYNSCTEFVSMSNSTWFILENASEEEKELMTSDFLCTSNSKEVEFLKLLGAKVMNRSDFFKRVVIPNIEQVPKESIDRIIENVLLNLSSMSAADPDFDSFLSTTKFIRSSSTQTLRSPSELYDPEVPMLLTLMDHDYFPDEFYMQPNLLLGLRKLGLKSTLSWETVLECARSIEAEASSGDDNAAMTAKGRGSELLLFLDINVETFFPELVKKSKKSRSGRFFKKMNEALFSDADKLREEKELQAQRVHNLLNIKWLPVHAKPPQKYLPWPENILSVAAPIETVTSDKMWLTSFSKRLVDGDVHSLHLKKLFGWLDEVSIKDVSLQLRMMGKTFDLIKEQNRSIQSEEERRNHLSSVCQKYSSEVGRMYHILNSVESDYEKDVIKSNLHASTWLWMGDGFISSDHIAYSSSINAQPYLFTVPPDLACFRNLLSTFNIRQTFGSSDYCMVLSRMAIDLQENKVENSARTIELAVSLVQKISDDIFRLSGLDIYAPTQNGNLEQVGNMVYDDAPWLSKDLPGKKGLIYAHEKLSASVCEKIGMTSVRKLLLHSTTDTISFGDGVVHEAFGQSESLTRRLKNIVEMYPEGTQQLQELIQNADDANASVVKFVVSTRQYGTSSLLGQKMADWQGGALYCYNDATFTARDFKNLSQIGQGSKLEKLVTTGRFGLGFNSVFHWTDVPQIVSGDHLVIFDPHAKYVPNATDTSRGIKIRFADTELRSQFPDQMDSYCYFGCDMKNRFEGTLFRFAFRTAKTAASSEISKKQYSEEGAIDELVSGFKKVISKTLLFLRHVKRIEFYVEKNECGPELQFYADVTERIPVKEESTSQYSGMSAIRNLATSAGFGAPQYEDWNSISEFIANDNGVNLSKEAFYGKLMRTPETQLPRTKHIVTINFFHNENAAEYRDNTIEDKYLICSALGAGQCRAIACNPSNFENKFLPWGNVAAHLSRNGSSPPANHGGNAYCFLPLPVHTKLPVHVNGYFELSANRRDIWVGSDMTGQGHIRSEWNRSLLWDVISPLYIQLLLTARSLIGPGNEYSKLWPTQVSSDIWKIVRSRVYQIAEDTPLFYTPLKGGQWVSMKSSVFLQEEEFKDDEIKVQRMSLKNKMLLDILLQENLNMVTFPKSIVECMKAEACVVNEANADFVRDWFKKEVHHPSLSSRENAVFLLRYCLDDIVEEKRWKQVYGLPLLPLANGKLGTITDPNGANKFFVVNKEEKYLMEEGSRFIVDTWTDDSRLNVYLMNKSFQEGTNLQSIDSSNFVRLISYAYPEEWKGLPEIHWQPNKEDNSSTPNNFEWLTRLWDYIGSDQCICVNDMHLFLNSVQIVPSTVGDEDRTLQILFKDMSVVNVEDSPKASEAMKVEIGIILRSIGIRTLDCSVFKGKHKSSVFKILKEYVKPSTVRGILKAFVNSFPGDLSNANIVDRMKTRFKYVDDSQKKLLREFMCDAIENDLNPDELAMLKMMPIFPVFSHGNIILSNLKEDALIPPSCADNNHLDESFVHIESSKDKEFMHKIGIPIMSAQSYYSSYAPKVVANTGLEKDTRVALVVKMLQDTLRLSEEKDGEDFVRSLSTINFVMNARGNLVSPKDLYDPAETALTYLVDDSMLPAEELRTGAILQSLRLLGMNTRLSFNGIIESARQIELQAKNLSIEDTVNEEDASNLRQRATALLNFLDDDHVVAEFNVDTYDDSSDSNAIGPSDIFKELFEIMWLPVEKPMENSVSHLEPPRRIHQLSHIGISSPELTRPKTDEWMCSASIDILSINVKSEALLEKFHWDTVPHVHIVAKQLVALGQLSQSNSQSVVLRQQISKVSSQMYEILNSLCSDEDLNKDGNEIQTLLSILENSPWIWVGDRFVKTSQVAFDAPENAKPFLYNVPEHMTCFEHLLHTCGVRDSFSGSDYVELLFSLSSQLNGGTLDSKQTDLAIFVARNLSRVPREELDVLDFSRIYLPSRDSKMYRANEMTFDDAPWLSAIVKKTRHVFVHPDVGNEAALILGAKSLRDILSSKQNGMVKIPCPKLEALQQLLEKRKESNQEYCRTILDVIEVGEMKGVKQVSITVDKRSHQTMSLVHPCLAQAQGPAVIICFHDISLEVDEVIRLTSPAKYYSSTTSGGGGGGGSGFPRYGRGLCGTFSMTDCLQVVTGSSFLIFDPSGQYLIEDKTKTSNDEEPNSAVDAKKKIEKANARNYGLSHAFCQQFPDQFDPFLSLNVGLEESLVNGEHLSSGPYFRGTIIRLPLRTADGPTRTIASSVFGKSTIEEMISSLEDALPRSVLFSYNLQSISLDTWNPLEEKCERILSSRISSSPLTRREHLDIQMDTKSWRKEKNKLNKLFKSSWSPKRGFIIVQISTRIRSASEDIVDSYAIQSVLGPKRLREMANTDSLGPLNLVPTVSLAVHLDRSGCPTSEASIYTIPDETLFVGFDTGIRTGLPFIINAPLFLHEFAGSVLLKPIDDEDYKNSFPGIRNIILKDKYNNTTARSLALYVWNRQAISSAIQELPFLLDAVRHPLEVSFTKNPRLLYKFWPYHDRIKESFRDFCAADLYQSLADDSANLYLTQNDGFKSIHDGCFTSPTHQLNEAASFFLQHMSMFTVPRLVVENLTKFDLQVKTFSPQMARSLLKGNRHAFDLSRRHKECLAVLQYCLADFIVNGIFDTNLALSKRQELQNLQIVPMADGSLGRIGDQIIIATAQQQAMMPCLRNKFISTDTLKILAPFLDQPGFIQLLHLEKFGPKILSQHVNKVLPSSWENKEFVQWCEDEGPSKIWLYQFWNEVSISSNDQVQLFRRWPLIPTRTGELASCGNARFIINICPATFDVPLKRTLQNEYKNISEFVEKSEHNEGNVYHANQNVMPDYIDSAFWEMGAFVAEECNDSVGQVDLGTDIEVTNDDSSFRTAGSDSVENEAEQELQETSNIQIDSSGDIEIQAEPDLLSEESMNIIQPQSLSYDPNSIDQENLLRILISLRAPLLDPSFFKDEDVKKLLPPDKLGVSRTIMASLNQSINYWSSSQNLLEWNKINSDDFDSLLESLSSQDGNRISLMLSDLTLMKSLPIFQTFAGNHITIQERDDNFTVDASVDLDSITSYLPLSLQTKLLAEKPQFKSLYEDLNVQVLNEATILQKFVLREFPNMPISQKESVIKSILNKWEVLRLSDDLISTLKETEFVKRKQRGDIGEIVFVKPSQLLDPRHPLLGRIFDNDKSHFPAEEFGSSKALEVLQQVGLGTKVDRDIFLKCAWVVEEEKSVEKGILLFEYFAENFGEFYDNNQEFTNSLCEICCVPGEFNGQMDLYRFADTAAPKDKYLVFKVTPVIPESCCPPQVMFSSLGIISPPAISTVLRQIRALTEVEGSLDRWTYKHASVETVFSAIFSFLQDNFSDLSPRVKAALSDRAIVPVGSSFVKANRLFFRLSQDLAPFFYEVPRAFGAYDVLLRQLGVRETPKSSDYAVSLTELNNEMGSTRLNANELNSVIEVVNLAATHKQQSSESSSEIFAPNQSGRLVSISKMMQNDQPWLIRSGRINMNYIHLSHAKMSSEICDNLGIKRMSEKVVEVLDEQFPLFETQESSMRYAGVRNMLSSNYFQDVLQSLLPKSMANSVHSLRVLQLVSVKEIKTKFFIIDGNGTPFFDISNEQSSQGPFCFVTDNRVLVAKLPIGVSCELAVATAICDRYKIGRHHVGGLSALLGSQASQVSEIRNMMGLYSENEDELFRGRPGYPLVETDLDLIEIKPLKMFKNNEIVAVRMSNESSNLIYGTVSETQDASSMSRLKICIGENMEQVFLSSQVYSFKRGSRTDDDVSTPVDIPNINVAAGVLRSLQENDSTLENELNGYKDEMTTVNKDEVLFAVEDLLKSADLSLNDDVKQMMASNLALKEDMNRKRNKVQSLQDETSEVLEGIDSFLCPITREIMEDPVIASDGHTYEREAIEMWFRTSSRSPKTNESISTNLVPNYALKSAIEAMSKLRDALKSFSNQD